MRYFKDTENELFAYNDGQVLRGKGKGLEEILSPIYNGKLLLEHINLHQVETKADGSYYDFYNQDMTADLVKEAEVATAKQEAQDKADRLVLLSNITITTSGGNVFDGDDTARADMMSAITSAVTLSLTETTWKLADNSWATIGIAEIREALALSIQAKGAILAGV